MTIKDAVGKSCNPVFSRIALSHLRPNVLTNYVERFGFNRLLPFDLPLDISQADIPSDDFLYGRTAAGFGHVRMSVVHAATMVSGIANYGVMPRPSLVDTIHSPSGKISYERSEKPIGTMLQPDTAIEVLDSMEASVTHGTSRKSFTLAKNSPLAGVRVGGKTGTLSGNDPSGVNHWFVGAAPLDSPEIAIAVLIIDGRNPRYRSSKVARMMLEKFYEDKI